MFIRRRCHHSLDSKLCFENIKKRTKFPDENTKLNNAVVSNLTRSFPVVVRAVLGVLRNSVRPGPVRLKKIKIQFIIFDLSSRQCPNATVPYKNPGNDNVFGIVYLIMWESESPTIATRVRVSMEEYIVFRATDTRETCNF